MATNDFPEVTRTALSNGKYRYDVDGVTNLKAATKAYTHVSVYEFVEVDETRIQQGRKNGDRFVNFHTRLDLAINKRPDYVRKVGHVTITLN